MARVLVVDDDHQFRKLVCTVLRTRGHEITDAEDGVQGLARFREGTFDLVVSDIEMPNMDGLQLLDAIIKEQPQMPVVMLTAVSDIKTALGALGVGAFDYVIKPFQMPELVEAVKRALAWDPSQAAGVPSRERMESFYDLPGIVAVSQTMRASCEMVRRVAPARTTHLVTGEAGTGRKLLARAIHDLGPSREEPFVTVRCKGKHSEVLEAELFDVGGKRQGEPGSEAFGAVLAVGNGTVLLQDVEALPLDLQERLIHCMRHKQLLTPDGTPVPVNARILATTRADLNEAVEAGRMQEQLYTRLTLIPVITHPLRERKEDVVPLAWHFLQAAVGEGEDLPVLARDAQGALEHYPWPGNVGELEIALLQAVKQCQGNKITTNDLPESILATLNGLEIEPVSPEEEDVRGMAFRARLAARGRARSAETETPPEPAGAPSAEESAAPEPRPTEEQPGQPAAPPQPGLAPRPVLRVVATRPVEVAVEPQPAGPAKAPAPAPPPPSEPPSPQAPAPSAPRAEPPPASATPPGPRSAVPSTFPQSQTEPGAGPADRPPQPAEPPAHGSAFGTEGRYVVQQPKTRPQPPPVPVDAVRAGKRKVRFWKRMRKAFRIMFGLDEA